MNKSDLRRIYKQKRQNLSASEIDTFQKSIYNQIEELDIDAIKNVHLFLSLKKFKEIDTQPIIDFFRKQNRQIIVSKSDFTNNTLSHFILESKTQIELNKYGIPEPVNAKQVNESIIDLVFVPLLISDEQNYRVGYGKGFYDRFLSECRTDVKTIGLNFFNPIAKISDLNEFDVPLHKVIYPKDQII